MITEKLKTWTILILFALLLISGIGNLYQGSIRKNDKIRADLDRANSNTVIHGKIAQIAMRDSAIAAIRKERAVDSLKSSVSEKSFKAQIGKLRFKISQLPQKIVYNPDSATVDSLRLSFSLKDSAINTQAIRITDLEAEKTMMSDSFHKEITQLTDNRNDQIAIANQLQNQLVDEQGKTRKEVRKKKVWRFISGVGVAAVGVLLLKPN